MHEFYQINSHLTVRFTLYGFEADELPDPRCLAVAVVFVNADDGWRIEAHAIFEKRQFLFPQRFL